MLPPVACPGFSQRRHGLAFIPYSTFAAVGMTLPLGALCLTHVLAYCTADAFSIACRCVISLALAVSLACAVGHWVYVGVSQAFLQLCTPAMLHQSFRLQVCVGHSLPGGQIVALNFA
jgi:hypothetical protein